MKTSIQETDEAKSKTRRADLPERYFALLDTHLANLVSGKETEMLELHQIAQKLFVSKQYLCEVIQNKYGHHPCYFYDQKILELTKHLLLNTHWPVAEIADKLTYDPSNFSKFFKKKTGETPGQFRKENKNQGTV